MSEENEVEVEVEVEQEAPENNQPSESEIKARRLGWVPEDEFKGDKSKWRNADDFLKRGDEIQAFMRADLEKLHNTLNERDRELAEIRRTMDEFRKFHNETEARAYKRAIDELKQLKVSAIEQGDGAKVVEIDEQIDQLKAAEKYQGGRGDTGNNGAQAERLTREFTEWMSENTWYRDDAELKAMAEEFGEVINAKNPGLQGKPFLDEVTRRVKRAAPEKFENPNRSQSAVASSSESRASTSVRKKKGYNDLPDDAKQACDLFVKQKVMTAEQYVKEFFAD